MRKSVLKVAAPVLALGISISGQAYAEAASVNADVKANVQSKQVSLNGGAKVEQRLNPIENRLSSVESELAIVVSELQNAETITFEQYEAYQNTLTSLLNRLGASANQLNAVTKKFSENADEIVEVDAEINGTFTSVLEAQTLLETIEILPDEQEVPVTEEPVEVPTEDIVEEPVEVPVDETVDELVDGSVTE